MIDTEKFFEEAQKGIVTVVFEKLHTKEIRTMPCTLNPELGDFTIEIKKYENGKEVIEDKQFECAICKRNLCEPSYETMSDNKSIFRETEITLGKCVGNLFRSMRHRCQVISNAGCTHLNIWGNILLPWRSKVPPIRQLVIRYVFHTAL